MYIPTKKFYSTNVLVNVYIMNTTRMPPLLLPFFSLYTLAILSYITTEHLYIDHAFTVLIA